MLLILLNDNIDWSDWLFTGLIMEKKNYGEYSYAQKLIPTVGKCHYSEADIKLCPANEKVDEKTVLHVCC